MRRRALLAAVAATVAGCTGTEDTGESANSTATGTPTPSVSVAGTPPADPQGFDAAVRERVSVRELQTAGEAWTLRYHTDHVAGTPFARQQVELATQFAYYRPEGVSLSATALHECTTIEWRVPASAARRYRADDVDVTTFVRQVRATTERINNC